MKIIHRIKFYLFLAMAFVLWPVHSVEAFIPPDTLSYVAASVGSFFLVLCRCTGFIGRFVF